MILLKSITETLRLITSSSAGIDYSISYADIAASTFIASTNEGKISSIDTTMILDHPSVSSQRQIKFISICNTDGLNPNTVIVNKHDSSGPAEGWNLCSPITLLPGELLQYIDGSGWKRYSVTGAIKDNRPAVGYNNHIQYNSVGSLVGDPSLTWDSAKHNLALSGLDVNIIATGITNEPTAPASGVAVLYTKAVVGKMQLKIKGPSGLDTPIQAALWQNNIVWWQPQVAAGVYTGTIGTNISGTNTLVLPTTTNLYTMMRRSTFGNSAGVNIQTGIRTENMFLRGNTAGMGGFLFACRFGFETWTAGDRLFVGLCAGTTAVLTVQPSTLLDTLGFCIESGDNAITFLHNDQTSTGTKTAIAGQPSLASQNGYDAYIWCAPNDSTVHYRLDNILTGATIIDTSIDVDLPVNTTLMTAQCIMGSGSNAGANTAVIGVNRMYIETDR